MSRGTARHRRRLRKRPGISPVAPPRMSQFINRAQELSAVRGVDAVFHHREDRPLVILDLSRGKGGAPVHRRREINSDLQQPVFEGPP